MVLLLCSITTFAQDYPFLTSATRKQKKHEFTEYLNTFPQNKHDSLFYAIKRLRDNGTTYTRAHADSVFKAKTKDASYYTIKSYRDTVSNQFYEILHKRSQEEMDADAKYWKEYFKTDEKNRKNLKGSTVKNLVMTDIQGNSYNVDELHGKVVIIDFWFTTCAPCIQEMPELNKIREEFGTDEVAYFGVTFDEKAKVENFLGKVKYDYTIVPDSKNLCDKFGIKFYPTTLVIDKKGKIVYTGDFMKHKEKLKDIRKLLKKLASGNKSKIVAGSLEKQD